MVFREGDSPIPVRWYFASPDAYAFPGWHHFPSANWVNRRTTAGDLGEQPGPRAWRNGSIPTNGGTGNLFALQCTGGVDPSWFESGIPAGEESGPYNASGLPECCVTGPPPPPDPCTSSFACGGMPDVLRARVDSASGTFFCGDPTGDEFDLVRLESDPCQWMASVTSGGLFGNFFFTAGDPSGGITEPCPSDSSKAFALESQYIGLVRDGPLSCDCNALQWTFSLTMSGISNLCLLDGAVLNMTVWAP